MSIYNAHRNLAVGIRMIAVSLVALILASLYISFFALSLFEQNLRPAFDQKSDAIGDSIAQLIDKVTSYGMPFSRLEGMESVLAEVLDDHPDLRYLAITNLSGTMTYWRGQVDQEVADFFRLPQSLGKSRKTVGRSYDVGIPLIVGGKRVGMIHVGHDAGLMQEKLKDILLDIGTVVVVCILMAIELLLFLIAYVVTGPIQSIKQVMSGIIDGDFTRSSNKPSKGEAGRVNFSLSRLVLAVNRRFWTLEERINRMPTATQEEVVRKARMDDQLTELRREYRFAPLNAISAFFVAHLIHIRAPFFLLVFAESMSLSFFPIFVNELFEPVAGLTKNVVIGLPISLFMLVWALSSPKAGNFSDRVGRRRSFLVGAFGTAIGLVGTGFSQNLYQLLVWRSLTALCFGLVFITVQGYIIDNTQESNRTRGMSMFLAGFSSGALCGSAIGGILADRIGYQTIFILSAMLAICSALLVYHFLDGLSMTKSDGPRKLAFADLKSLLGNKYFMALTFLSAIPAKVCLTGFLYYLGPLYLDSLHVSPSSAGRTLMLYGLAIIMVSPLAAWVSDHFRARNLFVMGGGVLSGCTMFLCYFLEGHVGLAASILALGAAHALCISPQLAMVSDLAMKGRAPPPRGTTAGYFRLIERFGSVIGPLASGALITRYGFHGAFLGIGVYTLASAVLFILLIHYWRWREQPEAGAHDQDH